MRVVILFSMLFCGLAFSACPSEECEQYAKCQQTYDEAFELESADISRFAFGGECWQNAQNADECTQICVRQIEALAEAAEANQSPIDACALP